MPSHYLLFTWPSITRFHRIVETRGTVLIRTWGQAVGWTPKSDTPLASPPFGCVAEAPADLEGPQGGWTSRRLGAEPGKGKVALLPPGVEPGLHRSTPPTRGCSSWKVRPTRQRLYLYYMSYGREGTSTLCLPGPSSLLLLTRPSHLEMRRTGVQSLVLSQT
jgi:hypothetical protein